MIYDAFQKQAIQHIKDGHSVIVSAPTGAGKTVIAEYVINDCLARNLSVVYTAPIKALSNQKYRDFQKIFKDKIGILTGDVSINSEAAVLIMTTEIFRNKILEGKESLNKYSWIIYDEIHYLDDYQRGTVWEESLIFLPRHMNMLALSATIPNIDQFAEWLVSIHGKPMKIVKEDKRPVPLHFFYQCQGDIFDNLHKVRRHGFGKDRYHHYRGKTFSKKHYGKKNRVDTLIKHLSQNKRLPCIYFCFSRKRCEYLAEEISGYDFLQPEERESIRSLYLELCEKFGLSQEKSALRLIPLVEKGIAYHHAGMLPTLKEVIERLFTSRSIKVIFTTETFALGINMPARTVIFDELRKFYGKFFAVMRTRDFYQMAGRAGRRGIDEEGFVYSRINPRYIQFQELKDTIYGEYEHVRSRFNFSYATILNLYNIYGESIYDIYPSSFHCFQQKRKSKERALGQMRSKVSLLKSMGYIADNRLTEKGIFASKVYGYELPLSQLYEEGILDTLSEHELGTLIMALVYEPRKGSYLPPMSKSAKRLRDATAHIINHIHYIEKKMGIKSVSKNFFYHLTPAIESWMRNDSFDTMLKYTDADEGEIIRYFRMNLQILREILDTSAAPQLKEKIRKSLYLINRDIVDAEKQLRMD